jgi:hypothetical protein
MMRFIAEQNWRARGDWEHQPPRGKEAEYKRGGKWSAPRAAFGLPLGIQFNDARDKDANGWIHMSRFPSPLRIRPLALLSQRTAEIRLVIDGDCGHRRYMKQVRKLSEFKDLRIHPPTRNYRWLSDDGPLEEGAAISRSSVSKLSTTCFM